jgi:membrane protease YdiL (CAAX protease family)
VGFSWQFLLKPLGIDAERQELFDLFSNVSSPVLLAVLMILAVVVAPITEELIFRAGIFRYVRHRLPRSLSFLIPALLFAALHYNLSSFAQLVVLGAVFSLAYERTGDIRVSMIAHGLFNLNSILLLFSGVDTSS